MPDLDAIRAAETRAKKIRQLAPEQRSEGDAALSALLTENQRLREALSIAADLLVGEGYDRDPDYQQEWQTISAALAAQESAE